MDVFVARQPIFDSREQVVCYELLFREGRENVYTATDGDRATMCVLTNSLLVIGMDTLTGGKMAFVNFTENLLRKEVAQALPRDLIALEVLESVVPDDQIVEACRMLKELGFTVVLDDFVFDARWQGLIELADVIKVDFIATPPPERAALVDRIGRDRVRWLAEKVETREEYDEARRIGYTYFQGYFFSKPVVVEGSDIQANKLAQIRILQEVNRRDLDLDQLEDIVKRDVGLSYKLLRYINSAAFGVRREIQSIRHALVMLGEREIVRWVTLVAVSEMAQGKPSELVVLSVARARFGELIAPAAGLGDRAADVFMLGMFSMIDAFVDRPRREVLDQIPLAEDVRGVLLDEGGDPRLAQVFDLVCCYERGGWDDVCARHVELGIEPEALAEAYIEALRWANEFV